MTPLAHCQWPTTYPSYSNYPSIDTTSGKPVSSSNNYKEWVRLQTEYMQWLESDLATMGLIWGAIEYGQREHVQSATSSKEMWDCLCQFHVTQWQNTNVHYYFQELYLRKWDERTSMSNHIWSFLNLKHRITEASHKLEDILVVHAILHFLPHSNIWDIVKWNLLDKGKGLTLDVLTAELISVYNYSEHDHLADKKDKKAKSDQIALFTKPSSSSNDSIKRGKKAKHLDKGKKPWTRPAGTKCHVCSQEGHWAPECTSKVNRDSSQPGVSANLAVEQL